MTTNDKPFAFTLEKLLKITSVIGRERKMTNLYGDVIPIHRASTHPPNNTLVGLPDAFTWRFELVGQSNSTWSWSEIRQYFTWDRIIGMEGTVLCVICSNGNTVIVRIPGSKSALLMEWMSFLDCLTSLNPRIIYTAWTTVSTKDEK